MLLDLFQLSPNQTYATITQTLIPRPIAWVMSDNGDKSFNLAPFSYFNAICSDPPLVMISVGKKADGTQKDTRVNIEKRDDFIIHIASSKQLKALNETARTLGHGESELENIDVELTTIDGCAIPRIKDCPIAYICKRYDIQEIGNNKQSLIIGEITAIDINEGMYELEDNGRLTINVNNVDPLMRLGSTTYASLGEITSIKRPA